MADQVKIRVGVEQSGLKTGLAHIRNQFRALKGQVGGLIVGGALASGVSALVEKASNINDIAAQFGVLPETLQRIGNAAQQNGSSLEAVGSALNKITLAQNKVRGGSQETADALAALKIPAEEFAALSPDEAFYRVADAVASADDRSAAYAAVVQLMGKSAGELVTTLEMGSDAIRQLGDDVGVMSDEAIQRLDDLGDSLDKTKNRLAVAGAEALLFVDKIARSAGAIAAGIVGLVTGNNVDGEVKEMLGEIWNPETTKKPGKAKAGAGDEDASGLLSGTKSRVIADRLTRVGGGGIAYYDKAKGSAEEGNKRLARIEASGTQTVTKLEQIRLAMDPNYHNEKT